MKTFLLLVAGFCVGSAGFLGFYHYCPLAVTWHLRPAPACDCDCCDKCKDGCTCVPGKSCDGGCCCDRSGCCPGECRPGK